MSARTAELVCASRSLHSHAVTSRRSSLFFLFALLVVCFAFGCGRKAAPELEAAAEPPVVTEATAGLRFTWIDERGNFHVEEKLGDVPEGAREVVRVADPDREGPGSGRVWLADLRAAGDGGHYVVRSAPRDDFEKVAVERRAKHGAVLAPKLASSASAGPAGSASGAASAGAPVSGADVVIYGASWCGPCHKAAAYLKKKGVAFVEIDIERDAVAQREMKAKLAKAGVRGGSIPVIDVRGRILVGFDERAVDRALSQTM